MITFSTSPSLSSFKFSARNTNIVLPECITQMTKEEQDIIRRFCIKAREFYVQKVVKIATETYGERIPLQSKRDALQDAIQFMEEELTSDIFTPVYSKFLALSRESKNNKGNRTPINEKPKVRTSTMLDAIEKNSI